MKKPAPTRFEDKDDVAYIWKIYTNEDLLATEVREPGSGSDHSFSWQIEPGVVYEVCLRQDGCAESQECKVFAMD